MSQFGVSGSYSGYYNLLLTIEFWVSFDIIEVEETTLLVDLGRYSKVSASNLI